MPIAVIDNKVATLNLPCVRHEPPFDIEIASLKLRGGDHLKDRIDAARSGSG